MKDTVRPRPLLADNFNASANDFCELFQRAGSASHFTQIWKTKVTPHMTSDGYFYDAGIGKASKVCVLIVQRTLIIYYPGPSNKRVGASQNEGKSKVPGKTR